MIVYNMQDMKNKGDTKDYTYFIVCTIILYKALGVIHYENMTLKITLKIKSNT